MEAKNFEIALNRLNMLKGHVQPSQRSVEERETTSFDVAKAQQALWSVLPDNYFETHEAMAEIPDMKDPSKKKTIPKDLVRESAKLFFDITNKLFEKGFTTPEKIAENIDAFVAGATSLTSFDSATMVRFAAHYGLYCKTIHTLGTERHHKALIDGCALRDVGAYALTELGHGSNVRGIETTATYCPKTKCFILNSPTETSMKFWIGNLAKTAFMAVVYAQLWTNGECHGVHAFLVQIRDKRDHSCLPGIEIGDCGVKLGLNGMDNGWMTFKDFHVPKDGLLDKLGKVDDEGNYSSPIENEGKRFALSIASLSSGRVLLARICQENALAGLSIAMRFSCARRQFGKKDEPETLIMDYPLHQFRLVPRYAESIVEFVAANKLRDMWMANLPQLENEKNPQNELLHALSSCSKAFSSWTS